LQHATDLNSKAHRKIEKCKAARQNEEAPISQIKSEQSSFTQSQNPSLTKNPRTQNTRNYSKNRYCKNSQNRAILHPSLSH
jgi:hypothetical protein